MDKISLKQSQYSEFADHLQTLIYCSLVWPTKNVPGGFSCHRRTLVPFPSVPEVCRHGDGSARSAEPRSRRAFPPHLQHLGEVGRHALHQHAVGRDFGGLPAGDVGVALGDQRPHLVQRRPRVDVVAQGLVNGRLALVETAGAETLGVRAPSGGISAALHSHSGAHSSRANG